MRHADELDAERAYVDRRADLRLAQLGGTEQAVLVQLRLDQPEREPGRPDLGDTHLAHQVGQGADVVLVAVGEDDRPDRACPLAQIREVGQDEVDAEVLVARERQPGVHDDDVVAALVDGHVLADLAQAAKGHDPAGFRHLGSV
jgi:hypothetical protein